MVRKIWEFWHKIIRNLVYIGPMAKNLAPNGVFSGSRYLSSSTEFKYRPLFHGNENVGILT